MFSLSNTKKKEAETKKTTVNGDVIGTVAAALSGGGPVHKVAVDLHLRYTRTVRVVVSRHRRSRKFRPPFSAPLLLLFLLLLLLSLFFRLFGVAMTDDAVIWRYFPCFDGRRFYLWPS